MQDFIYWSHTKKGFYDREICWISCVYMCKWVCAVKMTNMCSRWKPEKVFLLSWWTWFGCEWGECDKHEEERERERGERERGRGERERERERGERGERERWERGREREREKRERRGERERERERRRERERESWRFLDKAGQRDHFGMHTVIYYTLKKCLLQIIKLLPFQPTIYLYANLEFALKQNMIGNDWYYAHKNSH